ncbi:hypothetical protein LPJ53_003721 [Coemansia erecta]|uniref:Ribosomal silencing factor RsfS n=1 Tax=Coemansia erecta TaxID=147472 RepID=A0A9W7Y0L5_9FUNG|nr:hypothetical protein LPJ53_003721 [Coemansia erecta]
MDPRFGTATSWVRAERRIDREVERQQAEDDVREEVAEHQRQETDESSEEQLAPEVERLDPQSIPGLYPEFEAMESEEEAEVEEIEGDDSWYVDTSFGTTEEQSDQPLWQRRAAANLGRPVVNVSDFAAGSLFDMCRAVLEMETDITVLDVADRCDWTAKMVIAEAKSTRHMRAIAEGLLKAIKERNRAKGSPTGINVDGRESDDWMVVDLGSFIIHIMTPEARKTYDLEKFWSAQQSPTEDSDTAGADTETDAHVKKQ